MFNLNEIEKETKALFLIVLVLVVICIVGSILYNTLGGKQYTLKGAEYSISENYNFDNAKSDGYVIYTPDEAVNEEKVEQFYNDVQNNKNAKITQISYSLEGFQIIEEFHYVDGKFIMYNDYTRDPFANEIYKEHVISTKIEGIEIGTNFYGQKYIQEKKN